MNQPISLRFLAASLGFIAATASADGPTTALWEVNGKNNTVYLLGSVHLLHSSDAALPEVATAAYVDAETIVEELDISQAMSEMMAPATIALQVLPEGQTLPSVLGPELHGQFSAKAKALNLDPALMNRFQPWYAAMLYQQFLMMQAGFSPQMGVDFQIAQRATADNKPMQALETVAQQFGFFARLPLADQKEFLRSSLDEEDPIGQLREITSAWRSGDMQKLEALMRDGVAESPALFKALTTDRNIRWLVDIEKMLQHKDDNDYLVVVGALHMVGDTGLVTLLKNKGYSITQK